ncbi:MAG TPA: PaaX family transcriptional regulator C-terminal domain-containing protein, partial [Mycobacterium sp.]|nr:PaaX family transcriptional regulator C-terminal domain-containing protein [Mycobacterium sp.]
LRQGVWLRPANIAGLPAPGDERLGRCTWFLADMVSMGGHQPRALAGRLWDLATWAADARTLGERLEVTRPRLESGDTDALAPGFQAAAAVVRQLNRDPLLPDALLPPGWPGRWLRDRYDSYERAYQRVLAEWLGASGPPI